MKFRTFEECVKHYKSYLYENGYEIESLRVEAIVESLRDWSKIGNLEDTKSWFIEQQENCKMTVQDIPLSDCKGWEFNRDTGNVVHQSGDFFYIQGVRVGLTQNREVKDGWDQPILTQVGYNGGLLGLLRKKIDKTPHYLVEAKAEPGNPDKVQISPTLQATFANLKQAHGGSKPKFSKLFEFPEENGVKVLFSQWMSEDGGRLHLKCNKGILIEVDSDFDIKLPNNFRWLSLYQIKELIKLNSWVNPHVRGIISHL